MSPADPPTPQAIPFDGAAVEHDRNVHDLEQMVGGVRWAIVEYAPGAGRADWCDTPHSGYVLSGELQYEFDDGSPELRLTAQQGFMLPPAPRHRGTNHGREPARLFIIDALPAED